MFCCNTPNLQIGKRAVIDEVNTFFQCWRHILMQIYLPFVILPILTTIDNLLV